MMTCCELGIFICEAQYTQGKLKWFVIASNHKTATNQENTLNIYVMLHQYHLSQIDIHWINDDNGSSMKRAKILKHWSLLGLLSMV